MNNTVSCPVCGQYASESFKTPHAAVWRCQASDCRHFFAPNAEQKDGLCDYSTQAYKTKFIQRNHRLIDYLLEKRIVAQGQRVLDLAHIIHEESTASVYLTPPQGLASEPDFDVSRHALIRIPSPSP